MSDNPATSKEVGAPDREETEVTPAMVRAGVSELSAFNPDYASPREAVVRIFRAMESVAPCRLR